VEVVSLRGSTLEIRTAARQGMRGLILPGRNEMIRSFCLAVAVLLLAGFAIAEAQAEKKKDPRCVPNFLEACRARCIKAAGRAQLCPQYCIDRQKEYGCI
jgi:hypothetical protein